MLEPASGRRARLTLAGGRRRSRAAVALPSQETVAVSKTALTLSGRKALEIMTKSSIMAAFANQALQVCRRMHVDAEQHGYNHAVPLSLRDGLVQSMGEFCRPYGLGILNQIGRAHV